VILSGIVGNFRDGDRFGKLGVDLCARLEDITVRSACHFTWAAFASAWVRPIDESIAVFDEGVSWGLMSGDHPHAAYCSARSVTHRMFRGIPLPKARAAIDDSLRLLARAGDTTNVSLLRSRRRFTEWMMDADSIDPTMDGNGFSEATLLAELQATNVSKSMLSHFQALRAMQRYFAGEFAEAWRISQEAEALLRFSTGLLTIAEHQFFQSLVITALWDAASVQERAAFNAKLDANEQKLSTWAASSPHNFGHLLDLVRAERARLLGDAGAATEMYEAALSAARLSGFVHVEALAAELAAQHLERHDAARAAAMRKRAIAAYTAWGAARKTRAMRAAGPVALTSSTAVS
jgi:hypothetical protein